MQYNIDSNDFVDDPVGETLNNERAITVALGRNFIQHFDNDVSEINSVMPFYGYSTHSIYSSREVSPPAGVINNIESFDPSNKNVFCIDTSTEPIDIEKIDNESNSYLLAYNNKQDTFTELVNSSYNKFFYYRQNNKWVFTKEPTDFSESDEVVLFIHKNI